MDLLAGFVQLALMYCEILLRGIEDFDEGSKERKSTRGQDPHSSFDPFVR